MSELGFSSSSIRCSSTFRMYMCPIAFALRLASLPFPALPFPSLQTLSEGWNLCGSRAAAQRQLFEGTGCKTAAASSSDPPSFQGHALSNPCVEPGSIVTGPLKTRT